MKCFCLAQRQHADNPCKFHTWRINSLIYSTNCESRHRRALATSTKKKKSWPGTVPRREPNELQLGHILHKRVIEAVYHEPEVDEVMKNNCSLQPCRVPGSSDISSPFVVTTHSYTKTGKRATVCEWPNKIATAGNVWSVLRADNYPTPLYRNVPYRSAYPLPGLCQKLSWELQPLYGKRLVAGSEVDGKL